MGYETKQDQLVPCHRSGRGPSQLKNVNDLQQDYKNVVDWHKTGDSYTPVVPAYWA